MMIEVFPCNKPGPYQGGLVLGGFRFWAGLSGGCGLVAFPVDYR